MEREIIVCRCLELGEIIAFTLAPELTTGKTPARIPGLLRNGSRSLAEDRISVGSRGRRN